MSKLNITPLADRVLIKVSEAETKTASGIIIPDNAQEKPQKGKIAAIGKGTKEKFLPHLYDFFYEYASDSGNVPSC